MALSKLRIVPERKVGTLDFSDESAAVEAMFNPDELTLSSSVGWQKNSAKGRDVPELAFTSSEPRTLSVKLLFDTYDTKEEAAKKKDVRTFHTDKLFKIAVVDGDKHRPPVCKLTWGSGEKWFQGVMDRLEQKFTMFMENGTPVRATVTCSFKEWRTNMRDRQEQNAKSSDIAKRWVVHRGDSLSGIAAQEYRDPAMWRAIAAANGIDDPLRIVPGQALALPRLPLSGRGSRS